MTKKEKINGLAENKSTEYLNSGITQYLNNYSTILYLNLFQRQNDDLKKRIESNYKFFSKSNSTTLLKWYFNNQIHSLTQASILLYAIWAFINGQILLGTVTTLVQFSSILSTNLGVWVGISSEFVTHSNNLQRFHETIGIINQTRTNTKGKILDFSDLEFRNVSLLSKERELIKNISFKISIGQKMAIVGYTGSGKSTLIDLTLKAMVDFKGEIKINQKSYNEISVNDIVNIFSIVPQEVQLFNDTIEENIWTGSENKFISSAELVKICCLDELIAKLQNGLKTEINEGSSNISGGERQKIGLARALAKNNPVLILDEATASLDPKTERELIQNITEAFPKLSIIFVTHRYGILNLFDNIIVLNDGQSVEQGSFTDLKARGGLFADLYQASLE